MLSQLSGGLIVLLFASLAFIDTHAIRIFAGIFCVVMGVLFYIFRKKLYTHHTQIGLSFTFFKYYFSIGYALMGLWILFVSTASHPFVQWVNSNFVYINVGILFGFSIWQLIEHSQNKRK
jgi:predicted membrane protein